MNTCREYVLISSSAPPSVVVGVLVSDMASSVQWSSVLPSTASAGSTFNLALISLHLLLPTGSFKSAKRR